MISRRRGAARWAGVLAAALVGVAAEEASASLVGIEGTEMVVRFDPGERIGAFSVTVAGGTITANDPRTSGVTGGVFQNKTVRAGAGCTALRPQLPNNSTVTCPLAAAGGIRFEFGTAMPDSPLPGQNISVQAASLPVVVHGGPNSDGGSIVTSGSVSVDGGEGNDSFDVNAPSGTVAGGGGNDRLSLNGPAAGPRLDGGPGNDMFFAPLAAGAVMAGGPGDDFFDAEAVTEGRPATRQRIDCGDGADRPGVDGRDTLGPGCGPRVAGLRDGMTLGRFDAAGADLRMATGRVSTTASIRYQVIGPRPPGFAPVGSGNLPFEYGSPARKTIRVRGPVRTTVRAAARLRRALRTRRRAVNGAFVTMDVRRPGNAGDVTTVVVRGALRPATP
jgi:hypothetical protein